MVDDLDDRTRVQVHHADQAFDGARIAVLACAEPTKVKGRAIRLRAGSTACAAGSVISN